MTSSQSVDHLSSFIYWKHLGSFYIYIPVASAVGFLLSDLRALLSYRATSLFRVWVALPTRPHAGKRCSEIAREDQPAQLGQNCRADGFPL